MNARLKLVSPANEPNYEPAVAGPTRTLLVLLSELRHHQLEVARIEAEVAIHARAFADAQGEFLRPTPAQLRQRLRLKPCLS